MKENILFRKERHPLEFPSLGSTFKNIIWNPKKLKFLSRKEPQLDQFINKGKIPVTYFINACGLRGKRIGQAQISEKHSNFIINLGNAKSKDVINLINLIKKRVKNKFDLDLEEEIIII